MPDINGNNTATEGSMNIAPCTVRGEARWKIEIGNGTRRRQFFKSEALARSALKAYEKDQKDLGRAWHLMAPTPSSFLTASRTVRSPMPSSCAMVF